MSQPLPDEWRKLTSDVLNSRSPKETEVEVKDRVLSLTFAPVVDGGYVNVYGLDVTERKQAEEALRESEEKFREEKEFSNAIIDTNHTIIVGLDKQHVIQCH